MISGYLTSEILEDLKIGDVVSAAYGFSPVCGVVTKINKNKVIIKKCFNRYVVSTKRYDEVVVTDELVNITKKRIYRIGLEENEYLVNC